MMTRRLLTFAALAAGLTAQPAAAAVADFETKAPFYCEFINQTDGGLAFAHDFAACYYGPDQPADFPTAPPSVVMGIGFSDITITTVGGAPFDLVSMDLAFGPFSHGGLNSDVTTVTGFFSGGGSVSVDLTIDYSFDTYNFGWTGLSSVVVGELQGASEYIAFDNIVYDSTGGVPEASTWALMIAGFGLVGAAARRRRPLEA